MTYFDLTIQIQATEQYFPGVMSLVRCIMFLTGGY